MGNIVQDNQACVEQQQSFDYSKTCSFRVNSTILFPCLFLNIWLKLN